MKALWIGLGVIAIAYVAVCVAMFVFQRSLIYHPQPRSLSAPESTMKLPVDGAEVVVTVRPHPGPKAMIYFGGNAEDVSFNLEGFAEAFPDHALYLLHYRGYGGSTGDPSEEANHGDALALFRAVHARHPDVAIVGRSLGSGVATRLASEVPAARLVLVTPFDSATELAAGLYPWLPVSLILRDRYDSGRHAPGIRIPTTIVIAENDEEIPRASSDRLAARFAKGIAAVTVLPGVGHNDLGRRKEYREALQRALQ